MRGCSEAKVTVVIPNWNGGRWLRGCLGGLANQTFEDFRVIVVDNGSTDDSVAYLRDDFPDVEVSCLDYNYGFARAVNEGIRATKSPYVALLNNDTVPRASWLASLVDAIERAPADIGSVASKMLRMEQPELVDDAGDLLSWQGGAYKRGHQSPAADYGTPVEVFSACAGAALYRRQFLTAIGMFDERFWAYLEDVDVGLRGQLRGFRCQYVPGAEVLHHGGGSEIPRPRYVRLMTRNRLLLFFKNMPLSLLWAHGHQFAYGQLYFLVAYGHPLQSLTGYLMFLTQLPHVWRERRKNRLSRRTDNAELSDRLLDGLREPPLRRVILRRLYHAFSRRSAARPANADGLSTVPRK